MLERTVGAGDVELAILEAGTPGDPPMFLVHGFTGSKEDFADEVPRLAAAGRHVVAPDLRGHGSSSKPDSTDAYSLEIMAGDVVALADALGWAGFDLLGHSMGGMVAQIVTIGCPDRVSRLVLMDTHHGPIGGLDPEILDLGVQIALDQGLEVILELLGMGESPLGTQADLRYRAAHPEYVEWCDRKFLACSRHMYASMLGSFDGVPDRLERLRALRCPTLVMVGEEDAPFIEASQRMAGAVEGARLDVLRGGGHSPQFEARDEWRRSLDSFLAAS